jgi:hypothetical protein
MTDSSTHRTPFAAQDAALSSPTSAFFRLECCGGSLAID